MSHAGSGENFETANALDTQLAKCAEFAEGLTRIVGRLCVIRQGGGRVEGVAALDTGVFAALHVHRFDVHVQGHLVLARLAALRANELGSRCVVHAYVSV